ncbi:MAG: hypothetical protein A2W29_03735 [Gemmatimonadetes bacterium RBG_16_66_8]|nr:MAG: hypothetical protein A2W29_03735 [Gemmatimonadetes bacterium RBG_16_66_8]
MDLVTGPVTVGRFRTRAEAEMAAQLLEEAAIPSVIQSAEGMWLGPLPQGAALLVRADQAEQAAALLRDAGMVEDG